MKYSLDIQFFGGRGAGGGGGSSGGGELVFANPVRKAQDLARNYRFNEARSKDMVSKYGISISEALKRDLEPKEFKRVMDTAEAFMKENPDTKINKIKETSGWGVLASTNGTELNINADYFYDKKTLDAVYNKCVQKGFHPKGTNSDDIAWHEYGHMLVHTAIQKDSSLSAIDKRKAWNNSGWATSLISKAYKNAFGEKPNRTTLSNAKASISGYAKQLSHETIAEAYCDWHRNGNKANKFSIAIVEELKKRLK